MINNVISLMIVLGLFHSPVCYEICRLIISMRVTRGERDFQPALEMHGIVSEPSKLSSLQSAFTKTPKNPVASVSSVFTISLHCPLGGLSPSGRFSADRRFLSGGIVGLIAQHWEGKWAGGRRRAPWQQRAPESRSFLPIVLHCINSGERDV